MKKILFIGVLSMILLLAACGKDTEMINMMGGDVPTSENADQLYDFDMTNATDDLMEFASNPKADVFIDSEYHDAYKKIAEYRINGSNRIEQRLKGFEENYSVFLLENHIGAIVISVIGEQINGTDEPLYADSQFEFTTDTMEQLKATNGYGLGDTLKPNTKHQGIVMAQLEYPNDVPEKVTIEFPGVHNMEYEEESKSYVYYGIDYFFQPEPITLTKVK